jgi:hypothetical protein
MPEGERVFPFDELLAGLIELAGEGDARAVCALESLAATQSAEIPGPLLARMIELDAVGCEPLRALAAAEMRRRGLWRRYRLRQVAGVYGSGALWIVAIGVLSLLLLGLVFGGAIGLKWLLETLGF